MVSRRTVLTGLATGLAGLAGCSAERGDKPYEENFVEDNFEIVDVTHDDHLTIRDVGTGRWGPKAAIKFSLEVNQPEKVDFVGQFIPGGSEKVGEEVKGQQFVSLSTVYIRDGRYEFVAYEHTQPDHEESTGERLGSVSVKLAPSDEPADLTVPTPNETQTASDE